MIRRCKAIRGRGQPSLVSDLILMNHAPGSGSIALPVDQKSSSTTVPRMSPCIYLLLCCKSMWSLLVEIVIFDMIGRIEYIGAVWSIREICKISAI